MPEPLRARVTPPILFVAAFGVVLLVYGALPFLALPTLPLAFWTTGFSQSFVNNSLSLYAYNMGAPEPAAIAFGLAGAYPAAILIALGLHPADAYATMAAFWLLVAFLGAWRTGVVLGAGKYASILAALLWATMPVVWAHADYAMVSLGIALIPFYFLASHRLFLVNPGSRRSDFLSLVLYLTACVVSVFMDGYTFMMFAAGSSIVGAYFFVTRTGPRRRLLAFSLPVHASGFLFAYLLYAAYLGKPRFAPESLDSLRGWGADVTFFLVPTAGVHWLWDTLGMSVARSQEDLFGDPSVWLTTFMAPLLVAGILAWWHARTTSRLASAFLLVALFGLYMSLGPSLKVDSTRPLQMVQRGDLTTLMPASLAVAPTGSAWLSEHLPGFSNMRAAYRWIALAVFGLWVQLLLWLSQEKARARQGWILASCAVILLSNLPHPARAATTYENRRLFHARERTFVDALRGLIRTDERVAFLPFGNDFFVNYLASSTDVVAYNIGGDKNLREAQRRWPPLMRQFRPTQIDSGFADRVLLLLAQGEVDAVVLTYIDLHQAAHPWRVPPEYKEALAPVVAKLAASGFLEIEQRNHYAVARVGPEHQASLHNGDLRRLVLQKR